MRKPHKPPQPAGDTIALFEEAVRVNSKRLLAIARAIVGTRASPEDVVQQAVMNLFQHRDRYDWREPGGLLRRAVVNEALRLLRQPKMSMVADDQPARGGGDEPSGEMDQRETVAKVRAAIEKLRSITAARWCSASTSRCRTRRSPERSGRRCRRSRRGSTAPGGNWR
jgi:DNA-directed RNA polymerase specialized sigma24 family protein